MVGPQIVEKLSEYEPDWPIGGATATKVSPQSFVPTAVSIIIFFTILNYNS